jgi:hypothetical protein
MLVDLFSRKSSAATLAFTRWAWTIVKRNLW